MVSSEAWCREHYVSYVWNLKFITFFLKHFHRTKGGEALSKQISLDDKKAVRYEIKDNSLIIKKLTFEDDGKYECFNPETKESADINVVGKQDNTFDNII